MSISKVADLAGVSSSTVSRVINNHPRVAPETAKAVKAAMSKLQYVPSDRRPGPKPGSRSRNSSLTVAFFVLGTADGRATPAFQDLLRGVSDTLHREGIDLLFSHVNDLAELAQRLGDRKLDGVLLHGALAKPLDASALRGLPVVWLMGNRTRPTFGDQVLPDTYGIGETAATYLVGRGHRHVAYLNLDRVHWPFRVTGHAMVSAASELGAVGRVVDQPREDVEGSYWPAHRPQAADRLVDQLLKLDPMPTGLFIADDMQTALIQPALQRRGVAIGPGQVEIISCNNETPYLVGLSPRPAEIDIRVEAIGRHAVQQLVWRIDHRHVTERIITSIEPRAIPHELTTQSH